MNNFPKKATYTVKLSFTLFGTIVGAGFLSGAELVRFFPSEGFYAYAAISFLLYAGCFYLMFRCGAKYGGYERTLAALFGKGAPLFRALMQISSLIMCASMLAGLNAAAQEGLGFASAFPLAALAAVPLLYLMSGKGVKGLFFANLLLVPFILIFIAASARGFVGEGMHGRSADAFSCLVSLILYVSMNCYLAAPLVCDAGAQGASGGAGCVIASVLIGVATAVLLSGIARAGDAAREAQMPFLYALGGAKIRVLFTLICICGILTTLFSSWYPLQATAQGKRHAALRRAALLVAAFALSMIGLKPIIRFVYPLVGAAGAIFLAVCAARGRLFFQKPFFGERDERIHTGGKHAQNGGRRHNEV